MAESIKNLELVKNLDHKEIYLEEGGELLGFCIFFRYFDSFWIALMQKTKFDVRGLPQYLYHLKAKSMGINQTFTTGAEAQDDNLRQFKLDLKPYKIKKIYVFQIGNKINED